MTPFHVLCDHLTTATSIIGTGILVPTLAAAAAGQIAWSTAMFPVLGAALAIALPEHGRRPLSRPLAPPRLAGALTARERMADVVRVLASAAPD